MHEPALDGTSNLKTYFIEITLIAALWVALFKLNMWLFDFSTVNTFIAWVFLPAALRVLSVIVFGWRGAVGLFIGTTTTSSLPFEVNMLEILTVSFISAISPVVAVWLSLKWLGVPANLNGLTNQNLLQVSLIGALTSVFAHNAYFYSIGHSVTFFAAIVPMLVGDLVGTIGMLYLAKYAMLMAARVKAKQ